MKKILITNDDGIFAPGIRHLWNALKGHFEVTIAAPATEQSGVGVSITAHHPLRLSEYAWSEQARAWCVTGTPADCVKLALNEFYTDPPDLIVSGINCGANSGRNVLYSGTIGGVIEGLMHEIPGVAFSCYDMNNPDFHQAEKHVLNIVNHTLEHSLPSGTLLNVNFPSRTCGEIKGYKLARQGKQFWAEDPDKRFHPSRGHPYYWIGVKLAQFDEHEDSDVSWLQKGFLTAVPIHVGELTDFNHLTARKVNFEKLYP